MTETVLEVLEEAYYDELESIMNYLAIGQNLETDAGQRVSEMFLADVGEELNHAERLSERINVLGGHVSGSEEFTSTQTYLQPPEDHTDVLAVIEGSIEAEKAAQETYKRLIRKAQEQDDYVTEDLAIELLEEEQKHEREMKDLRADFIEQ